MSFDDVKTLLDDERNGDCYYLVSKITGQTRIASQNDQDAIVKVHCVLIFITCLSSFPLSKIMVMEFYEILNLYRTEIIEFVGFNLRWYLQRGDVQRLSEKNQYSMLRYIRLLLINWMSIEKDNRKNKI